LELNGLIIPPEKDSQAQDMVAMGGHQCPFSQGSSGLLEKMPGMGYCGGVLPQTWAPSWSYCVALDTLLPSLGLCLPAYSEGWQRSWCSNSKANVQSSVLYSHRPDTSQQRGRNDISSCK
jgi:hypothetical protein